MKIYYYNILYIFFIIIMDDDLFLNNIEELTDMEDSNMEDSDMEDSNMGDSDEKKIKESLLFNLDIISNTDKYKINNELAIKKDYIRDICDEKYSILTKEEIDNLDIEKYINVVQKSDTWLELRARSCGTASNIGKYVYNKYAQYANISEVQNAWRDKLNNKGFEKNHTTDGHMSWGVKYETLALIHLGIEENIGISQVGSIKVELKDILNFGKQLYKDKWIDLNLQTENKYILVSPDGIVGTPEEYNINNYVNQYKNLKGMLEIKCISPFYHLATTNNKLTWCHDLNKRQWYKADKIPYVYIVQQALQAISGVFKYDMKSNYKMWFIRWSPVGFSIFKFKFIDLVKLGVLVSNLYFSFYEKLKSNEDILKLYPLYGKELDLEKMIEKQYLYLLENNEYKYVEITDYPEFNKYYKETKNETFIINEKYN